MPKIYNDREKKVCKQPEPILLIKTHQLGPEVCVGHGLNGLLAGSVGSPIVSIESSGLIQATTG